MPKELSLASDITIHQPPVQRTIEGNDGPMLMDVIATTYGDTETPRALAGIVCYHFLQELQSETSTRIVSRQPATCVVGLIGGENVAQRIVRENTWGGANKPFYPYRLRRAKKKVGRVVMQHLV